MKTILYLFALPLCLAATAPGIRAEDAPAAPVAPVAPVAPAVETGTAGRPTQLKFSDPSKPGTVRLKLMWGDVTVTGADTPEVTILANIKNKSAPEHRADGLRRLDSEVTYTASEKDNVITIELAGDAHFGGSGTRLALTVPRNTSIVMKNALGGNATVKDLTGDIEIHSINGEVRLDQINGSALVDTMNGEINASFTRIAEGKPLSFTSMNGEINVRIPADTKANVRLRTQNGAVYTDFDEQALVTKTEATKGHFSSTHRIMVRDGDVFESDDGSAWHKQVRDAVREATRAGVQAAREAAKAAREAARAAREGIAEARDDDGDGPEAPEPPEPPEPPAMPTLSGGKIVTGTLNGGGPEIQIATMNGAITLRKAQP